MDEIIPIGITCLLLLGILVGLNLRVFGFQFLAYYYLFYFLGYAMRRFNKLQLTNKEEVLIILGFTICGFLSWVIVNLLKKNMITAQFFLGK